MTVEPAASAVDTETTTPITPKVTPPNTPPIIVTIMMVSHPFILFVIELAPIFIKYTAPINVFAKAPTINIIPILMNSRSISPIQSLLIRNNDTDNRENATEEQIIRSWKFARTVPANIPGLVAFNIA